MPNLYRLLKYVPATSSAFFSYQNISQNTYFQIARKNNGSEIWLHVHAPRFLLLLRFLLIKPSVFLN